MLRKFVIQWCTFLLILLISFSSVNHPITTSYINELREQAVVVMKEEDPLYMEILSKQKDYKKEPKDAIIHKVWHAVPGYNGIEIDIQASYHAMQEDGHFDERKLVIKQIPPQVKLTDLPPSPIYRGHEDKPLVALMINVAWGNEYIPEILKKMNKHRVRATFFLDGTWVKNNPSLAKMIVEEGHEIGNHAYSHPNMKNLSQNRIHEEMVKASEIIKDVTKQKPKWFAPPSGSFRQEVVDIAHDYDMHTVLWSVDTVDWKNPNPQEMSERVTRKVENGSLVLMHPTSSTAIAIESIIRGIKEKGLQLGTLTETLSETHIIKHQ